MRRNSANHEALTPLEQERTNSAILRMAEADPANWRTDGRGWRYYVGPTWAGDGTINWPDDPSRARIEEENPDE